jgi:hypothetical protein
MIVSQALAWAVWYAVFLLQPHFPFQAKINCVLIRGKLVAQRIDDLLELVAKGFFASLDIHGDHQSGCRCLAFFRLEQLIVPLRVIPYHD